MTECKETQTKNEPLIVKRRGEDGSRILSVRINEETLHALGRIAAETDYPQNEPIRLILAQGPENMEIQ